MKRPDTRGATPTLPQTLAATTAPIDAPAIASNLAPTLAPALARRSLLAGALLLPAGLLAAPGVDQPPPVAA